MAKIIQAWAKFWTKAGTGRSDEARRIDRIHRRRH